MGATDEAGERHEDALAERFFSEAPPAWEIEHEDWQSEPLTSLERLAILVTVAPLLSVVVVGISLLLFSTPVTSSRPERVAAAQVLPIPMAPPAVHVPEVALEAPPPAPSLPPPDEQQLIESAPIATRLIAPPATAPAPTPTPTPTPRKQRASEDSALVRARKALSAGDAVTARVLAEEAIQKAPEKAAAYIVLAGALDQLGHRAGKNAAFRACVEQATDALASACKTLLR